MTPRHQPYSSSCDQSGLNEVGCGEGANLRSVWWVAPAQYREGHYAVMPDALAEICMVAGCPKGGIVLDPFGGAGTTGMVADRLKRNAILIELNAGNPSLPLSQVNCPLALGEDFPYL